MDQTERQRVIDCVLKKSELFELRHSRFKRLLKDPFHTLPLFVINVISKIIPFKINYKTFWGDKLSFYLPEGYAILTYGFFEPNLTNFIIRFLQKNDTFIDVGAHIGYYSSLTAKLVGTEGKVYSFEPTPRTFISLVKNTSSKANVVVNNNAVMDSEEEIEFSDYGPKYSAFNSFQNRTGESVSFLSEPKKIKVETVSLDKYCDTNAISPTLIKIDAEGAEHIILKAMNKILTEKKPMITIEVAGGDEWIENRNSSMNLLREKGYVGYEITVNGFLKPHVEQSNYEYDNLVFAHPDNSERIKPLLKNDNN